MFLFARDLFRLAIQPFTHGVTVSKLRGFAPVLTVGKLIEHVRGRAATKLHAGSQIFSFKKNLFEILMPCERIGVDAN